MSTSDKLGDSAEEASMDEILASIRKIIADDPNAPRTGPDQRATNPLLEPSVPAIAKGNGPLLPPATRFGEVLRTTTDTIRAGMDTQRPAAPARGRPFADRALDELFDDGPQSKPGDQPAVAAIPAQAASITAAAAKDPWAAWRNLQQTSEAAAPGPVQPAPAQPEASARPVVEAAAPPVNGAAPASATPAPVPGSESTSNAGPWKPLPSVKPGFYPPTSPNAPRRQPSSFAAAFPRNPGMAEPAVSDPVNAAPDKPKDDGAMPASGALNGSAPAKDTSRLAASTLNGSAVSGEPAATSEAAPFASAIAATAAAANQALEKLNAGLTDTPAAAAPVSTPVVQAAAPSPSVAPPSVAAPGLTAGRTLDDMVGDMLRPMLEKWVEANMPRLMEKALRPVPPKDNGSPKA